MTDQLPEIDPRLKRVLDAERASPAGPSAELAERLWSRLQVSIPSVVAGASAAGLGAAAGAESAAGASAAGLGAAAGAGSAAGAKLALVFLLGAALGGGAGFMVGRGARDRPDHQPRARADHSPTRASDRAAASPAPSAASDAASPRVSPASPTPGDASGLSGRPAPPRAARDQEARPSELTGSRRSHLADERALLDRARMALGRGDPAQALISLELHQRRYPRGVLREEREASVIVALINQRQLARAEQQLQRFLRQYPSSLMARPLQEALRRTRAGTDPAGSGQ